MRGLTGLLDHEPRATPVALGRSLVALAEFTVLAWTPDADLFPAVPGEPGGPVCTQLHAASLWCLGSGLAVVWRVVALVVLAVVASGYRPRWTCVPHWYVTYSLGAAVYVPNGGEHAAALVTLLLIPLCLGDRRTWQWSGPREPMAPRWLGAAYAAHLAIRVQVAVIYGQTLWAKVTDAQWWRGTALHYVFQDPYFGAPPAVRSVLEWTVPVFTWGTLVLELAIAVSAFCGRRWRRRALVAAVVLHAGIAVVLGLPSFSLVMIGLVAIAVGGGQRVAAGGG